MRQRERERRREQERVSQRETTTYYTAKARCGLRQLRPRSQKFYVHIHIISHVPECTISVDIMAHARSRQETTKHSVDLPGGEQSAVFQVCSSTLNPVRSYIL